jgi:hypothetical protein
VVAGAAGAVALVALGAVGLVRSSDVFHEAFDRAQSHPRVVHALGQPIRPGWSFRGSISTEGPTGNAELIVPISGPDGSARIYIVAERSSGTWSFERLEVKIEGRPGRIDLLGRDHGRGMRVARAPSAAGAGYAFSPCSRRRITWL